MRIEYPVSAFRRKKISRCFTQALLIGFASFATLVYAQGNEADEIVERNYLGAEIAANATGDIPALDNSKLPIPKAWQAGKHYLDPFDSDQALFQIDSKNVDQYRANLAEGQRALLARYPEYNLPVYLTRRSARYPDFIIEATTANSGRTRLSNDGMAIQHYQEGFPFPELSSHSDIAAMQAIWNHRTRYRGGHVERTVMHATVFGAESFTPVTLYQRFSRGALLAGDSGSQNVLFYYLDRVMAPSRLSGSTLLVHESINDRDQGRRAWIYDQALKRVRRSPSVAYDAPVPGTYGLRTVDSYDMFNGAMDKYQWQYLGKQEIYVPYNSYRLTSGELKYADILGSSTINPRHQRWELHRVHKIEARLKSNERHIYARRVFYLDEDSWSILLSEQYDQRGQLWRISEGHLINYYDQDLPYYAMEVTYDFLSSRYHVFGLSNEEQMAYTFSRLFKLSDYVPATLRRHARG